MGTMSVATFHLVPPYDSCGVPALKQGFHEPSSVSLLLLVVSIRVSTGSLS